MDFGVEVWPFMMMEGTKASLQAVLSGCLVVEMANICFDLSSHCPLGQSYTCFDQGVSVSDSETRLSLVLNWMSEAVEP